MQISRVCGFTRAIARAKSKIVSDQRTTSKLNQGGVDFIELRSLDLNPFSRIGIDKETTFFLEVLLTYCFIKQREHLTDNEMINVNHNDALVAKRGREPNLELSRDGKKIKLKDWGNEILEDLLPIASVFDCDGNRYSKAVDEMIRKIDDSNQTLSGRLLEKVSNNISFTELGEKIGTANKVDYLNLDQSENTHWDLFERESIDSVLRQKKLEKDDQHSFEVFVENYFKN